MFVSYLFADSDLVVIDLLSAISSLLESVGQLETVGQYKRRHLKLVRLVTLILASLCIKTVHLLSLKKSGH